jgi:hypothetical protein
MFREKTGLHVIYTCGHFKVTAFTSPESLAFLAGSFVVELPSQKD